MEKCISAYDQAIRLNPDYARVYNNRGNANSRLGQHKAAVADYDEAIRLNPDYARAYFNRGNANSRLGQHKAAVADYGEAIRLNPDYARAYCHRGILWLQRKEWDKARPDLHDAKNKDVDIIATFRRRHTSVADFEMQYGVKVPEDIKRMLEP